MRLPPLFWYETYPEQRSSFLMALLLYWNAKDPKQEFELLAPFYYKSETPDEKLRIVLPVHFSQITAEGTQSLWGPYYHSKSLKAETKFLFPVFFDLAAGQSRTTIAPLYIRQKTPERHAWAALPLYWHYQNLARPGTWDLFIPFYLRKKTPSARTFYSPFFWSYKDAKISQGFGIPYYWRNAEDSKSQVVFPVYWRFAKKDGEAVKDIEVAVPWFRLRSQTSSLRSFFPIYWGRSRVHTDEMSSATITTSRWDMFIPLYFGTKSPEGSEKFITPLFSRFKDADGTLYGHTGLNFFKHDVWGGKTELFLPLFYYRGEPDSFRFKSLLFFIEKDNTGRHARNGIFPIYSYRRDSDRVRFLTPLFFSDRDPLESRGFLLNYYWSTVRDPSGKISERDRVFFPLAWHFESEQEKSSIFPPLAAFWKGPEENFSYIFPLYFNKEKKSDRMRFVFPVYTRHSPEKESFSVLFLYWRTHRPAKDTLTLFPFYRRSSTEKGTGFFLPGFYYSREGDATQGAAFPYVWDHRGRTQYSIFFPLYIDFKRPTWKIKSMVLGYQFTSHRLKESGFFPIWAVTKSVAYSSATFTPAPQKADPEEPSIEIEESTPIAGKPFLADSHRVIPFYLYRRLDRGTDLWLLPLLGRIQKEKDSEGYPSLDARYLLMGTYSRHKESFTHRFDPIFGYESRPRKKSFSMPTVPFPLWKYEAEDPSDPMKRKISGAFFPYYWKKSAGMERDLVFPLYYHRQEKDPETHSQTYRVTWLLLYYANQNSVKKTGKNFFFPLYWHGYHQDRSWTLMPPFWRETGPDLNRKAFFPLYFQSRKDSSRLLVLFPLYFKSQDDDDRSKNIMAPGFWSSTDQERKSLLVGPYFKRENFELKERLSVWFPFYWSRTSPEKSNRTLFPLYWEWKGKEDSLRYFFPIYFRRHKDGMASHVVAPVFWRFRTREMDVKVIPPYYSLISLGSGTKTNGVAPFWTYSKNERENWSDFEFLGGLIGVRREGDKKEWTLLYLLRL